MAGKSVIVAGAGGNIGSHLVPHLGRMPGVSCVALIDRDKYERKNTASQDMAPRDAGKPKAQVQARRLRRIHPGLAVEAICSPVEALPLGKLRGDVLIACLDSRRARLHVNQAAWRLGMPWIDTGVLADGLLARVNVYVPAKNAPCLECAWSQDDYAALEQTYACGAGSATPAPTNAPSALGALAAALGALECMKLLAGLQDSLAAGKQVTVDARWHHLYVTAMRRNAACRFDHEVWRVEPLRCRTGQYTIRQAINLGGDLSLEGLPFVQKLRCPECGHARPLLRLERALRRRDTLCAKCGARMSPPGGGLLARLDGSLDAARLERTLAGAGLRTGDIFRSGRRRLEILPGSRR